MSSMLPARCIAWLVVGLALDLAPSATAAPVNPAHRLEDANLSAPAAADALQFPATSRVLVLSRTGEVHRKVGDGLEDVFVATIPTETSCGEHGVLSAAWDPQAAGRTVFVTYTAARNRALAVGRLDLETGAFVEIFSHGVAATCTNVGGGLAFGDDGALLLGVGDMEQPTRAGGASNVGKIFRLDRDGRLPGAPLTPNPQPSSPIYGTGVRNPVRLTSVGGAIWFLDAGPAGGADELDLLVPSGNFGWSGRLASGYQDTVGLEDPYATLPADRGASGLTPWRGLALGPSLDGGFLTCTRSAGDITAMRPDMADRATPTIGPLFTRDAGDPGGFELIRQMADGLAHVVTTDGRWMRLAPRGGAPVEPAAPDSILPLSVRKDVSGAIVVAVERVPGAAEVGLYVGDLTTLASSGYSHADAAPFWHPVDLSSADALVRIRPAPTDLGRASYVLASGRRDCLESGLGSGDAGPRPQPDLGCSVGTLGGGSHSTDDVRVTEIATAADRLNLPRDLAFHPEVPGELWIVNQGDHSVTILHDAGTPSQSSTYHAGPGSEHFMSQPSALDFGPGTGYLATAQEEDDYTQGPPPGGTPQDFMGPTLWIWDSAAFDGGHASHYDMLHNSPNAVGIAWDVANRYWVFDGYHRSLTRYDFQGDHGAGGSDHSDAIVRRYAEGQVGYVPGISSHLVVDHATGLLYAADTASARIVMLDPSTGGDGGALAPNYDGCSQRLVVGATLTTLVDGAPVGLIAPSGVELHDDMLFVSDNATSRILAFDMSGALVDYLETGFPAGTLQGMAFDPRDGSLWLVDTLTDRVIRIAAP